MSPGDLKGSPDDFLLDILMKKGKTLVLIDAGYLSKIKEHFGGGVGKGKYISCPVERLAMNLATEENLWCDRIYYYTAPPYQSNNPTPEERERKAKYDKFIEALKKVIPEINIREGRLQKISDSEYSQKGVDTKLTLDLMEIAQKKEVEKVILLACDTDFVPIIEKVTDEYGLKVILAYFFTKKRKDIFSMSNYIMDSCEEKILIRRDHFKSPQAKASKMFKELYKRKR